MECLVQYLDSLEDLIFATALKAERIRQAVCFTLFLLASVTLQAGGVLVALKHPPLALGVVALLVVGTLFRSVLGLTTRPCATI